MNIEYRHPWLIADLRRQMRAVSWAPHRSGVVDARRIVWREVRNADLTPELDVEAWLAAELKAADLEDSVAMLTSRNLETRHHSKQTVDDATAECLATVGLGNAERVGHRADTGGIPIGTINLLLVVSTGLAEAALLEALTIAAEARTIAVTDAGHRVPGGIATGTGTDCIVVAAPVGGTRHVGKHTDIGEALGKAAYEAVSLGVREWMAENS